MTNKKDKKPKEVLEEKSTIETLKIQTRYGFKKQFEMPHRYFPLLLEAELDYIIKLGLQDGLLSITNLVNEIKEGLGVEPIIEQGDFYHSLVAISLGITKITDINTFGVPLAWHEMIKKKILSIYYPIAIRNQVVEFAKESNYNTSTHNGQPIVKFNQLYIKIEEGIEKEERRGC